MKEKVKKLSLLLTHDEVMEDFISRNSSKVELRGSTPEIISSIRSFHYIENFITTQIDEEREIPLSKIVWTNHPSYQYFWNQINGDQFTSQAFPGNRDPGIEGTQTGWCPRKNKQDSPITLLKHPDQESYCIQGDGNNRVMKSLTTPNSSSRVYATIYLAKWLPSALFLIHFLEQYNPIEIHLKLVNNIMNHHGFRRHIYIGLRKNVNSRMFYLEAEFTDFLSLEAIFNKKLNRLKEDLATCSSFNIWARMKAYWALGKYYIQ